MAKRKYPKLPNGYGSLSFLSGKRRNPWCVRPPVTEYNDDGKPIQPKPICYTDTWLHGFAVLTAWKAGTYEKGMEKEFRRQNISEKEAIEMIIIDYMRLSHRLEGMTFKEVYDASMEWKFSTKTYSEHYKNSLKSGYKHCEELNNLPFKDIRTMDLQKVVDDCQRKSGTKFQIKNVLNVMYDYAIMNDIVQKNYAKGVRFDANDVEHGQAFSEELLKVFWEDAEHGSEIAKQVLVMCYSGFRISEYPNLVIDFELKTFTGGSKTDAGKNRIVPIHSLIYPYVSELIKTKRTLGINSGSFTKKFHAYISSKGSQGTPHWTRHTFSALCEHYHVRENDRKRMLGHVIGDVTNDVYGHRTIDELREEIEKINRP